ncbi:MAG: LysR family transcriptional regulator [Candidatus Symbiobacter sp.]|nr:LysR family transcriptional regulator [Candidatus Symbiobacter sp.]
MLIRQLQFMVALEREKHFARAAQACKVTQPSLSAALRQLEAEMGTPLVERGQRFQGFTAAGHTLLTYAKRVLAELSSLEQEIGALRQGLVGQIRIGAIPTVLPLLGKITAPFCASHPNVTLKISSMSSIDIERGLHNFDLDLGLTYLDNEPLSDVRSAKLFYEEYFLLLRQSRVEGDNNWQKTGQKGGRDPHRSDPLGCGAIGWADAANYPLCLLDSSMQNRRIIDAAFRSCGVSPHVVFEADNLSALVGAVRQDCGATIVPRAWLSEIGRPDGILSASLVLPSLKHEIGWVIAEREPFSPLAAAMMLQCQAIMSD